MKYKLVNRQFFTQMKQMEIETSKIRETLERQTDLANASTELQAQLDKQMAAIGEQESKFKARIVTLRKQLEVAERKVMNAKYLSEVSSCSGVVQYQANPIIVHRVNVCPIAESRTNIGRGTDEALRQREQGDGVRQEASAVVGAICKVRQSNDSNISYRF